MEMVSAAKLKRFQKTLQQGLPYTDALEGLWGRLHDSENAFHHPLMAVREEREWAHLVITSDTGLCGSFNTDLTNEAKRLIASKSRPPLLIGFGKNGAAALARAGITCQAVFKDVKIAELETVIKKITLLLETLFRERKVDAVYVTRPGFTSQNSFRAVAEKILPFPVTTKPRDGSAPTRYIFEPGGEFLFTKLIPMIFEAKIREVFLESFVAEQMSRMSAMHQATENAGELIESLTLTRNKIRQAAITNELIEIVSGSRALKT